MKENYEKGLKFILKWEGEISDHPNDPGGLTIYGIAKRYHPAEVERMKALLEQGKKEQAKQIASEIYKKRYWDAIGGDNLKHPFDILAFDTAVNMGVQVAVNFLKQSGDNPYKYLFLRVSRYVEIAKNPKMKVFLQGWLNRVVDLAKYLNL